MKRQRPSLDTSFGSLSLGRPALSVSASDAQRVRADSAASHSSSSVAFTTPPDGRSPYYHPRLASSLLSTSSLNPTEAPRNDAVLNLTHSPQDTDDLPVETPEIYEYVKAKYDYTPTDPSGLSFTAGQFIQVHYKDESGWWNGEVANVRGWFPSNYLVEDSSKFVRAPTQHAFFQRARKGSTPLDSPQESPTTQTRNIFSGRIHPSGQSPSHPPFSASGLTRSNSNNPYFRKTSLTTTSEHDEHSINGSRNPFRDRTQRLVGSNAVENVRHRIALGRSVSAQNIHASRGQVPPTAFGQSMSATHSRQPSSQIGHFVAANRGYGASSPTPQISNHGSLANGAQQDWDALSFDDLIVLQTMLAYPSPISKSRQPDSTVFEDELNQRFMAVLPASVLENATRTKTNGIQYLEVVHRALWVLENAAVATALQWNQNEGTPTLSMDVVGPSDAIKSSLQGIARDFLSPAIYCVIGSVRTALSSADCLARNSVNLRTYPILQNHRKDVLTGMARLVTQTKRLGHRGLDEPSSPLTENRRGSENMATIGSLPLSADGSGSSSGSGCSASLASVDIEDVEVRRELERSQCVYENVRRFIIAVFECGIVIEEPQYGVVSLLGLAEDEEAEMDSEGEGSWEEDPSFRFRIPSTNEYGVDGFSDHGLSRSDSNRYAIRARRFAQGRPSHSRARAGSNTSMASVSYGSSSPPPRDPRNSDVSSNGRPVLANTVQGIEQRLKSASEPKSPPTSVKFAVQAETTSSQRSLAHGGRSIANARAESALALAAALRAAKSLGDLKSRYRMEGDENKSPTEGFSANMRLNDLDSTLKAAHRTRVIRGPTGFVITQQESSSRTSKSSFSSISSQESFATSSSHSSPDTTVIIPTGPCTVMQTLSALRATQDRILHGTAAFIGAAQYHSRSAHPASKGHLVALTREIVDFVRRLLLIADAVLTNATIRDSRAKEVEMAGVYKARLYVEMNKVVDTVRDLTTTRNSAVSDAASSVGPGIQDEEDEENGTVLKRAHLANKCASELVLALKLCLSFRANPSASLSDDLLINIPEEVTAIGHLRKTITSHSTASSLHKMLPPLPPNEDGKRTSDVDATPKLISRPSNGTTHASPRARSHTTRDAVNHSVQTGLHKKATSMVGMNAIYQVQSSQITKLHPTERLLALQEERRLRLARQRGASNAGSDMFPKQYDSEAHPLLMSEGEESDSRDVPTPEDTEESLVHYIGGSRATRRSIEQVRRSLERGLMKRPSMDMVEPSTPLDGTEEIVEEEDESEEAVVVSLSVNTTGNDAQATGPSHAPQPSVSSLKAPAGDASSTPVNGDIIINAEGNVIGATLQALVNRITPPDVLSDPTLSSHFLLTFRLFASPLELVDAIIYRFQHPLDGETSAPSNPNAPSQPNLVSEVVQLRVINLVKEWARGHWYAVRDEEAIPPLLSFFQGLSNGSNVNLTRHADRVVTALKEMSERRNSTDQQGSFGDSVRDPLDRMRSAGRLRNQPAALAASTMSIGTTPTTPVMTNPVNELPRPLSKALLNQLKARQFTAINVLDFNPVELARQLTMLESRLYCAVPPEEVIEKGMKGRSTPHVNALINLNTSIAGWVTDWILKEGLDTKKRVAYIKFFLKVGRECLALNNLSTPRAMMAALESTPISRLRSVWTAVPQKHKIVFQEMHGLSDHNRNFRTYRERLRRTEAPAVPFLGLILSDVTFTKEGNAPYRPSPADANKKLINFNRYNRLAKIMGDMIRLQQQYNIREIPEIQNYLTYVLNPARITSDADVLHRRSLLIEPRQEDDGRQQKGSDLFGWAANFGSVRGNPS
ncbi:hypothetical protein FRC15_009675 [Serendipita sp. 397]|nr:hypothetical protein FRC15_009675 [Serendipita sp. 397]